MLDVRHTYDEADVLISYNLYTTYFIMYLAVLTFRQIIIRAYDEFFHNIHNECSFFAIQLPRVRIDK